MYQHDAIAEVAVIGVPHEKWQEVPAACVVLKPGATLSENELIEFCNARLARFKVPKAVYFLDELPKSGAGKILKTELRKSHGGITVAAK